MKNFFEWLQKDIVVISGVHGDEKAPVKAMQGFKSSNSITFIAEANPSALRLDRRTGQDELDLNRQFRDPLEGKAREIWERVKGHKLLVTLHEWDGDGFFVYYTDGVKALAKKLLAIGAKEFGIAETEEKHLQAMKHGLVCHDDIKNIQRNKYSLETYAKKHGIDYITTETPVNAVFDRRVAVNKKIIEALYET